MKYLTQAVAALFRAQTRESDLEQYLKTKNITSHSDLEYFVKQFDNSSDRRFWW